jgi:GntR family transcriptional regulator, transcriptional repressor for pyruvate dehydrogenase complex
MAFKPIKTKKLYEEVVEQIRQLMAEGELKPGDKLLPERELAEKLQVSRPSVREAIRMLEMLGFIEIRPRDGTFVRNTNPAEMIQPLAVLLTAEKSSLLEMFEVRRIHETANAGLAAERASEQEIRQLATALRNMKERLNVKDSERGEKHDIEFHSLIAEATHNALLTRLFRNISEEFSRAVSVARRGLYADEGNPQKIIDQHRRIYQAIKKRDPEMATRRMLEHLSYAEREMRRRMA